MSVTFRGRRSIGDVVETSLLLRGSIMSSTGVVQSSTGVVLCSTD